MSVNPFRPVQLGASVALSTVLSGGVSTLPPGNFSDVARALVGFCGVALSTKVVCETLVDDANAEATAQESEVQAALTRDLYRANHAYYREFPHHWKARQPVPDQWLELWGQTGGKPYLALHPSSPQAFAPVAPIAQSQTQTQTQTVTVREPGVTRGGSFGIDDDFAPVHPPAPIAPTFSAPIQSAISREVAYTPDLFDWNRFVQYPDRFPHACVVGASGDGKTSTQEYIARLIGGGNELIILSTKRKGDQWVGLTPIGLGRNFAPIAHQWGLLSKELDQRCLDLDHAQTQHQVIIAIDELNDIISNTSINLANIARAGREPRLRLIVNSHTAGVEGLGLQGKNEIKSCFTWVRLGNFALQHAQQLLNKGFLNQSDLEWLRGQQWPCMVDDVLAQVPDLSPGWQSRLGGYNATSTEAPGTFGNATPETWERPTQPTLQPAKLALVPGSVTNVPDREPLDNAPSDAGNRFFARPDDREVMTHCMALGMSPDQMQFVMFDRVGCGNELAAFTQCRTLGMNQEQCIFATFYTRKGRETKSDGSPSKYGLAKHYYDQMIQETNAA